MHALTYCCVGSCNASWPCLTSTAPPSCSVTLSVGQGKEILQKVHGLSKGQVDDLPITIKGKSDSTWGNYFNLPIINRVG